MFFWHGLIDDSSDLQHLLFPAQDLDKIKPGKILAQVEEGLLGTHTKFRGYLQVTSTEGEKLTFARDVS